MACYYDENGLVSDAFERWNQGYDNVFLGLQDPTLNPGLTTLEKSYENGVMSCKFQREGRTTILNLPSGGNVTYDLKEEAYHLLLAYGPGIIDNGGEVILQQHDDKTASATGAQFNRIFLALVLA